MNLAFLDTETTGLDPNKAAILDIAIVRVVQRDDSTPVEVTTWHTKIKPTEAELALAEPKALGVNGFTPAAWEHAQSMAEIGPRIVSMLDNTVLVGHNVAFDEAMIKANLARHGVPGKIPYRKIDTQVLAMEHLFPLGLKSGSLDSIREFLGWSSDGAHTALQDTLDCKRLFDLTWRMTPWQNFVLRFQLSMGYK